MNKLFFLKYVSSLKTSEIVNFLEKELHISFEESDSDYFGVYFKYTGKYCDRIVIKSNEMPDGEKNFDDNKVESIIEFSFTTGKNLDKEKKYQFIKSKMKDHEKNYILIEQV